VNTEQKCDILIENWYADGHTSRVEETEIDVPEWDDNLGAYDFDGWWGETVFPLTGDGHGIGRPNLSSVYTATVIAGPEWLVGKQHDWSD
jgi:hypothetical protein